MFRISYSKGSSHE